jgi:transcriptional regulator with GAF, ATPase, and Fis domain
MGTSSKGEAAAELVIRFDGWTRRVPLGAAPVVLGRSGDCDVSLPDPKLSRRHCRIAPAESGWLVEDLDSRAGTFLGGVRLEGPAAWRPGEELQIGTTRLQLKPAGASVLSGDPLRDERNVEVLLKTIGELHGTEGTAEVLRTIVDRAILVAGGDRGALLLTGPGGSLEVAVARRSGGRELPPEQVLTRSIPDRALETGRAVLLTDVEEPAQRQETPESVLRSGLRSVLCVPLPGPDGRLGVLYVDGSRPAEDFGPADLAAFEALAAHGALAIERARLREERERRQEETRQRLEAENAALKTQLQAPSPIGESPAMRQAVELVRRFAPSDATVCLTGETGTGKEVIARHLHSVSLRASGPFVVVDCGSIPAGLIESELFGHEERAFTGAGAARKGLFREADGGTVFLDEIGELPLDLQTRLLRVLQERTVQPVGGSTRVPVDVRVVCATNRDLGQRVSDGAFRQDLYYRISVLTVAIPPLRDRGDDVLLLARHFLARFAAAYGIGVTGFTREAVEALYAHAWPGNVRELEHRVQRAVLLASPPFVTRRDLGLGGEGPAGAEAPAERDLALPPLPEARELANLRFERAYLEEALQRADGKVVEAAALAGVSQQLFRRLLKRHEIDRRRGPE